MSLCAEGLRPRRRMATRRPPILSLLAAGLMAAAVPVGPAWSQAAEHRVPVHVVRPAFTESAPEIALSGEIQARVQSNIAFRLDGKVTERQVEVGQHVAVGQTLARLDPTEQKADLDNAQAGLNSADALLQQAATTFERQKSLLDSGFTTRASYDSAQAALKANEAQVEAARAALATKTEQLTYTDLKAAAAGIIVSRDVESGQVVQAGQTVFVLAEDGPRDAVFNISEALLIKAPKSRTVDVVLQADRSVTASGEVREISPTVDPATSTVKVKVGLSATPPRMTLGAAIVGTGRWDRTDAIVLPWSALFEWEGKPAVWVVDEADVVSVRTVSVARYATGSVILSGGLDGTQRVVTAGIQFLHPGQQVAVVGGDGL